LRRVLRNLGNPTLYRYVEPDIDDSTRRLKKTVIPFLQSPADAGGSPEFRNEVSDKIQWFGLKETVTAQVHTSASRNVFATSSSTLVSVLLQQNMRFGGLPQ
jgi:hypothetical protein